MWEPDSRILQTTTQLRRISGFWKHFRAANHRSRNLANNNVLAAKRLLPDNGMDAMLTTDQINELHRLYWSERWPIRKIERHLRRSWRTIKKYLDAPAQGPAQRQRESKLDPFKSTITEWLEKDPSVTAAVIQRKLRSLGYRGGHTILREFVHSARPQ